MNEEIEKIRDILEDVLNRRNTATDAGVQQDFLKVVLKIRFLFITNTDVLTNIWDSIRIQEPLVDYILNSTAEFLLRGFNKTYTFENLCEDISNVYNLIGSPNSLIDNEILASMPPSKMIKDYLLGNPWFVFLYMCEELIDFGENDGSA